MSTSAGASLEERVREIFGPETPDYLGDETRVVDELSGGWRYGPEQVGPHLALLRSTVREVVSEVREPRELSLGDAHVVTFQLHQSYRMDEQEHRVGVEAPTTVVGRRGEDGDWEILLVHCVPSSISFSR